MTNNTPKSLANYLKTLSGSDRIAAEYYLQHFTGEVSTFAKMQQGDYFSRLSGPIKKTIEERAKADKKERPDAPPNSLISELLQAS